jgi:hypothetical protein
MPVMGEAAWCHGFRREWANRRVRRFAAEGTDPVQFVLVRFIAADHGDRLALRGRANRRGRWFSPATETLAIWTEFNMPGDLAFGHEMIYVAGGDRLSTWTRERRMITRFAPDVAGDGSLNIHGIRTDTNENVWLAQFARAVSKLTRLPS